MCICMRTRRELRAGTEMRLELGLRTSRGVDRGWPGRAGLLRHLRVSAKEGLQAVGHRQGVVARLAAARLAAAFGERHADDARRLGACCKRASLVRLPPSAVCVPVVSPPSVFASRRGRRGLSEAFSRFELLTWACCAHVRVGAHAVLLLFCGPGFMQTDRVARQCALDSFSVRLLTSTDRSERFAGSAQTEGASARSVLRFLAPRGADLRRACSHVAEASDCMQMQEGASPRRQAACRRGCRRGQTCPAVPKRHLQLFHGALGWSTVVTSSAEQRRRLQVHLAVCRTNAKKAHSCMPDITHFFSVVGRNTTRSDPPPRPTSHRHAITSQRHVFPDDYASIFLQMLPPFMGVSGNRNQDFG